MEGEECIGTVEDHESPILEALKWKQESQKDVNDVQMLSKNSG